MKGLITANKILQLNLFKGFIALLNDAQGALLVAEAVIIIVLIIWSLVQLQMANSSEDENNNTPHIKKRIKWILITGALIVTATAFVPVVLSYFTEGA